MISYKIANIIYFCNWERRCNPVSYIKTESQFWNFDANSAISPSHLIEIRGLIEGSLLC